jgi:hypothetical protein
MESRVETASRVLWRVRSGHGADRPAECGGTDACGRASPLCARSNSSHLQLSSPDTYLSESMKNTECATYRMVYLWIQDHQYLCAGSAMDRACSMHLSITGRSCGPKYERTSDRRAGQSCIVAQCPAAGNLLPLPLSLSGQSPETVGAIMAPALMALRKHTQFWLGSRDRDRPPTRLYSASETGRL